jgi:hypothetical protein
MERAASLEVADLSLLSEEDLRKLERIFERLLECGDLFGLSPEDRGEHAAIGERYTAAEREREAQQLNAQPQR